MNIETPTGHPVSGASQPPPPPGPPGGGGPQHQQHQQAAQHQQHHQQQQQPIRTDKDLLNSYIYDYLLKHNLVDSARAFSRETDSTNRGGGPTSRTSTPNPNVSIL